MQRAYIKVLERPPYHGKEMADALSRMGYKTYFRPFADVTGDDVLLIWNRYDRDEAQAAAFEAVGARVIVVENGFFGRCIAGGPWYTMALGHHAGLGQYPEPDISKWNRLGYKWRPWKEKRGDEIVVLASRGMGERTIKQPSGWPESISEAIRQRTGRPVRIRKHPGPQYTVPEVSLEEDIHNAFATVTWASAAGLKSIMYGIPCYYGLKGWIGAAAARHVSEDLNKPYLGPRLPLRAQLATAIWSLDEIKSGEAFRCLLT